MMPSKENMEMARTLLRVAGSMTDRTIADRLKAIADGYERRAVKASRTEADKPAPVITRSEQARRAKDDLSQ
jgi:hypothetical protein